MVFSENELGNQRLKLWSAEMKCKLSDEGRAREERGAGLLYKHWVQLNPNDIYQTFIRFSLSSFY
jgi:hypothetical protein